MPGGLVGNRHKYVRVGCPPPSMAPELPEKAARHLSSPDIKRPATELFEVVVTK